MADERRVTDVVGEGAPASEEPEPASDVEEQDDAGEEVEALRDKVAELAASVDRAQRTAAFYDTRRRQAERELEEKQKHGFEPVAKRLLPVVDSLDRALDAAKTEGESKAIRDGIEMVRKQLMDALESEGVRSVASIGLPFDPNIHEAVAYQPTADVSPHHVVAEVQKGYTLHDRLLRAATVLVAAPAAEDDASEDAPTG